MTKRELCILGRRTNERKKLYRSILSILLLVSLTVSGIPAYSVMAAEENPLLMSTGQT